MKATAVVRDAELEKLHRLCLRPNCLNPKLTNGISKLPSTMTSLTIHDPLEVLERVHSINTQFLAHVVVSTIIGTSYSSV